MYEVSEIKTVKEALDFLDGTDSEDIPIYMYLSKHKIPVDNYQLMVTLSHRKPDEAFYLKVKEIEDGTAFLLYEDGELPN